MAAVNHGPAVRDRPESTARSPRPRPPHPRMGPARTVGHPAPPRRRGARPLVRCCRHRARRASPRRGAGPARSRRERVGRTARVRDRGLRGRHRRRARRPRVGLGRSDRALDGRPQRDRLRGLVPGAPPRAGDRRFAPGHSGRSARSDEGARRAAAPAAPERRGSRRRFRLLPPETRADPALLAHLARESVTSQDGAVSLRFDPACYAARVPADGWQLVPRISAPTLVVRGELSPILTRPMAERLRAEIPGSRLVEIPGAYHHVVLDRPEAFVHEVRGFLDDLDTRETPARPSPGLRLVTGRRP